MLIILEGPDGSGKSTLIDRLAQDFDYPIYRSGGPKTAMEMIKVLAELEELALSDTIYLCDRTPWVSEIVYGYSLNREPVIPWPILKRYWKLPQKIIYCYLEDSNHMLQKMNVGYKSHKPIEHTSAVIRNHRNICAVYDLTIEEIGTSGVDVFSYDWEKDSYYTLKGWI